MAGSRRAPRSGAEMTPLRIGIITGVLLVLVLAALRLLPGSPLAANAAAQWGEPDRTTSAADHTDDQAASRSDRSTPSATPTPELPPLPVRAADITINAKGWWAWSMQDTRTGEIVGSANMGETSTTASLIKSWIGADFLRRSADAGRKPTDAQLQQVRVMIRDSDNNAAESLYNTVGRAASIQRLISTCKLTDSSAASGGGWSRTELSPRDITRLAACIGDGRAAGPTWTKWLLDEMRAVRGIGDFGIRKAFPAAVQKTIAIKNGWVDRQAEQEFHVSCLAIGDGWTMGVMTKYPINLGYTYGAKICQQVAEQLRAD
ncbi:class A beta-lactamase-related serine hydrolase [Micromonospora sp. NBC_01699]|uniref:serine hydrolase n=1 Tax=Micromonospora sp. NBC_01699 TaxID=2975984 RepID=UPI002E28098B|nr:serine hydrolase [Micromonospora sp. NBC_01699]